MALPSVIPSFCTTCKYHLRLSHGVGAGVDGSGVSITEGVTVVSVDTSSHIINHRVSYLSRTFVFLLHLKKATTRLLLFGQTVSF